jgi:uracil-DNA glycosylase family 4
VDLAGPVPPSPVPEAEPSADCPLCPRLVAFRHELREEFPDWWNAPVRAFGDPDAWLAIVGLAPGKHGANRTGRPFTGDFAGILLYRTLMKFGLAEGSYEERADDGLRLAGAVIVNAVRCLPPANKPLPEEISACRTFYAQSLEGLANVKVLIALGQVAHGSAVRTAGGKLSSYRFGHLAEHRLPDGRMLIDSYHCSRYNQNTKRLTEPMFEQVFARAIQLRGEA